MHMPEDSIKCYISQLLSIMFAQTECLASLELFKQARMAAQPVLGTLLLPHCWDYKRIRQHVLIFLVGSGPSVCRASTLLTGLSELLLML